jgi:hypothetical protein
MYGPAGQHGTFGLLPVFGAISTLARRIRCPTGESLRNVYQVLRDKELELEGISHEVEALRLVVPLLVDGADGSGRMSAQVRETGLGNGATTQQIRAVSWP